MMMMQEMMMNGGMTPEGMMPGMMPPDGEDDGGTGIKPPKDIGEDEDFLFENFLKQGEYQHIQTKKRQWREADEEDEDLGLLDGI